MKFQFFISYFFTYFLSIYPYNIFEKNLDLSLENKLKLQLISNYNRDQMFLSNKNITLVNHIYSIDIDQENNIAIYNILLNYSWKDTQLIWNYTYWNTDKLSFTSNPNYETSISTPYLNVYKSAEISMENMEWKRVNVNNNGDCQWLRPGIIKVNCQLDIREFPYDTQTCSINFTSENIFFNKINQSIKLDNYDDNNHWKLINYNQFIENKHKNKKLQYIFKLKRIPDYYLTTIVYPVLFMILLVVFTPLINNNTQDRINYLLTIALSLVVFLLIVLQEFPKNGENSKLSKFIFFSIIFCVVSIFINLIIISLNEFIENLDKDNYQYKTPIYNILMYLENKINKKNYVDYTDLEKEDHIQRLKRYNYLLDKFNCLFFMMVFFSLVIYIV